MSRWESLKSENGQERARRSNDSGPGRNNNRWASLDSHAKVDKSRQPKDTPFSRSRQPYQRPNRGTKDENAALSKIERVENDKLPILIAEHDTILNSLKSELLRYQSDESNQDHEISAVVENLIRLLHNTTNIGRLSTVDELPCSTDIFMALLHLLKLIEDQNKKVSDYNVELGYFLLQSIISYLKVSDAGSETNALTNMTLTKSQVEVGVTTLSSHYHKWNLRHPEAQSRMADGLLIGIALLVKSHVSDLAPELTAQRIVGAIFIPYLSSLRQDRDRTQRQEDSSAPSMFPMKHVCGGIIALLANPSHASAILAPLVEDFTTPFNYGIEEQTINPLRMKLLRVLLKWLEPESYKKDLENEKTEEIEKACCTLSVAIDGIRKLRKGNETENIASNDADVRILKPSQKFILQVVTQYNEEIRISDKKERSFTNLVVASLQLLRALVACYPKLMTGIGWKLIIEGGNRNMNSTINRFSGSSRPSSLTGRYLPNLLLIPNAHNTRINRFEATSKILSLAMDSIADLISILPWNKWLRQSGKKPTALVSNKAMTSGLYKTVVDALCKLLSISKTFFHKCNQKSQMKALGRLLKAIMMEIPYCDTKLISAGEVLWEEIAEKSLPLNGLRRTTFSDEKQFLACDIMVASSGGTITPQGNMRGMSVPARSWFLAKSRSATSFLESILDAFDFRDGRFDQSIMIFSSLLRTLPDVALQRWDVFLRILGEVSPSSNRKDLMRMEVLESFMLGRRDFEVSVDLKSRNETIIVDLEQILLQRWNQTALQRCMTIYSTFRRYDWTQLDQIDGRVSCHLDKILSYCQNSKAKIREGAARAVGEFCTQYIMCDTSSQKLVKDNDVQPHQLLIDRIHRSMLDLCSDNNAGARSMAIFSLGNLCSALKGSKAILEKSKLHEIHKAILYSVDDTNDKVVKNAIRSVGHASNLLATSQRCRGSEKFCSTSLELLVETIDSLTSKLWNTLHVALNEEQKSLMTWKERSVAKKHGWGACYSLGLVFEGLWLEAFEDSNDLVMACSRAARCLIRCPCHHSVLNEKVVLAAMAAICHLPSHFFIKDQSQEVILGDVLTTSILILASNNDDKLSAKLLAQNEPFLLHLLESASIADATIVLDDDRITTQDLDVLYSWMVEGTNFSILSTRAFEIFALAFQYPGRWSAAIEFEQKFASRALQKRKQEGDSISDDDEADEL